MKPSRPLFAAVLIGGVAFAAHAQNIPLCDDCDMIPSGLVDPPLIVTNRSGAPVSLQWQSAVPGAMLSPARSATIPAGATAHRIEPGLFWIVSRDGDREVLVDNDIYVSRLDGERFAAQATLRTEGIGSLEEARDTALAVTVAADGSIDLATAPDR